MAGSGSLIIDSENLTGSDGTPGMSLRLWSSRNQPCTYDEFQSLYFELVKDYSDEGALEKETAAEREVRMRAMCQEVQSEVHGPEHLVMAAAPDLR